MLIILVSTISKYSIFAEKMWVAFAYAKATHIFLAKILAYLPYNQSFNDSWTNNIVSFEQLGPDF